MVWAGSARGWLAVAGACACALAAAWAAGRADARPPAGGEPVELALFPSGRLVREASLGHPQWTADLAWLTAIQYYGRHRRSDRSYPLADHLFRVVTEADPGFARAYLFGALILCEQGDRDAAEALLRRGVNAHPESWLHWFELGFFHYVETRSFDEAARAMRIAARLPGAPEYVGRFAAAAAGHAGDRETALSLWETVARGSGNEEIRRMAEERIAALRAELAAAPEAESIPGVSTAPARDQGGRRGKR